MLCACGGGDGDGDPAKADAATGGNIDAAPGGDPDAAMAGMIPDPGPGMNTEWTDVEPNNDPAHAVPQGILTGPIWAGFATPYTQIDDANDTDFFVFKTGASETLANVYISLCGPANSLDVYLYKVDSQMQGDVVSSAEGTDSGCAEVVGFGGGEALLTADTTYLLEVRAQPGIASTPAMYSA
jgi:hypothetical protein